MLETQRILRLEAAFPTRLADLPKWPEELQVHGSLRSDGVGVAIVGARAASGRGMRAAHDLAADLARRGCRVISGGALGIDSAAHRGALSVGGYTMAIMACGLDQYYPRRNQRIFEALLASGGAMVSPFAMEAKPVRWHFVRRNQVIAALADVVVVVEASTGSGSLHTARFALELGRRLAVLSGSPGCEALLARGVPQVRDAAEVMELLQGIERYAAVTLPDADSPEGRVLAELSHSQSHSAVALSKELGLSLRQVQRVLHGLELRSLVLLQPGQRYVRSPLAPVS